MKNKYLLLKTLSLVLVILVVMAPIWSTAIPAKANPDNAVFYNTEKRIIADKFATPSGGTGSSFTLSNLVPYLHTGGTFDAHFSANVRWDGNAVAAAFVPAVLEDYKYTGSSSDGQIIAKRPTIVGLIAVFRGSHHEGTTPNGYYIEDYELNEGKIYLHAAVQQTEYQYTVEIETETTNTWQVAMQAWVKARVGISLGLKLFDFADASLNLASVEAGVQYSVKYEGSSSTKYIYKVTFSVPTYKIIVNYQSLVSVTEELTTISNGNGPTPTSKQTTDETSVFSRSIAPTNSYTEISHYTLNAAGTYVAYSDYMDISPYTGYHEFNGDGTTGMIIFSQG